MVGTWWGCHGDVMGTSWGRHGDVMGHAPEGSPGVVPHHGDVAGTPWGRGGARPRRVTGRCAPLWGRSGDTMGTWWGRDGDVMGTWWGTPPKGHRALCPTMGTWWGGNGDTVGTWSGLRRRNLISDLKRKRSFGVLPRNPW